MDNEEKNKGVVILDIDGVVNSFSNKRFYSSFTYHVFHELAKIKGRKQLLRELPKMRKMGGPNALFKFARHFCDDEETFQTYRHNLSLKLNYNLIKHNPSLAKFTERLCSFSDVVVRSDGLSEIAYAAWQRVMTGRTSAQIKKEIIEQQTAPIKKAPFAEHFIRISGIAENNFIPKAQGTASWLQFAKVHGIDLSKSVLIDDSQSNCQPAKKLGMTVVNINKLDSFLEGSPLQNIMYESLSDVLGIRMTQTLKSMDIKDDQKIDGNIIKSVFDKLLTKSNS